MVKINYSKVEMALIKSLNNMFFENLENLASIAIEIQSRNNHLNMKEMDFILKEFRADLKKLKNIDSQLYTQLNLTLDQETRLLSPIKDFKKADWLRIIELRDRMVEIKAEKTKKPDTAPEDEVQIAQERQEHKNKRFNVRKGWLPLH